MKRTPILRRGLSPSWDVFVQLGATDDTYKIPDSENLTYRSFINSFLAYHSTQAVEDKLKQEIAIANDPKIFEKLKWLGIFEETKVGLPNASPAQIVQQILEKKWILDPNDKDMVTSACPPLLLPYSSRASVITPPSSGARPSRVETFMATNA